MAGIEQRDDIATQKPLSKAGVFEGAFNLCHVGKEGGGAVNLAALDQIGIERTHLDRLAVLDISISTFKVFLDALGCPGPPEEVPRWRSANRP